MGSRFMLHRIALVGSPIWRSFARSSIRQPRRARHTGGVQLLTTALGPSSSSRSRINDHEDLHRFTRGRFVQDEARELASRFVDFNVDELVKAAILAVSSTGSTKSCVRLEKLAEGQHNKALLLVMSDGSEVIAKLPHPNAGRPYYTTASEVATMEYMRSTLSIPVPTVYAWCGHAQSTPVRSEYILMSRATGVSLSSVWQQYTVPERFSVVEQLVKFQSVWTDASYTGYGSIYFAQDLPPEQQLPLRQLAGSSQDQFVLGPITGREWSEQGRADVDVDRGPWPTLEKYLKAIGKREERCIKQLPRLPYSQAAICGPNTYQPTRAAKIRAVQCYLQLLESYMPQDPAISKPSAWHADLHADNIFVDASSPAKITALIDWQSTEVVPLFYQARPPFIVEHDGPQHVGLQRPKLPPDYATMSPEDKSNAYQLYLGQSLNVACRLLLKKKHADIWKCIEWQSSTEFDLLLLARNLLVDGEAPYLVHVADLLLADQRLQAASNLHFSEKDLAEMQTMAHETITAMSVMTAIKNALGDRFPDRGYVSNEDFAVVKDALRQSKEQVINDFSHSEADRTAWATAWPFDD